jgi:hypothetical protein
MIKDLWYKNAVVYCLSVGTYMDANGDGIGDFQGLMRRLDYLHGLGVTAIWLMPFQASPGRDDGYDVSDYYGVNPVYGTLGDFVEFTHGLRSAAFASLLISSLITPPTNINGFKRRGATRSRNIATGMFGQRSARRRPIKEWSFRGYRSPPGATIA